MRESFCKLDAQIAAIAPSITLFARETERENE